MALRSIMSPSAVVSPQGIDAMRLSRIFAAACMLPAAAPSAFAWGNQGHQIVCEIAFQNLTSEAKTAVSSLRSSDPEAGASFAETCVWPDRIFNRPEFSQTGPWHYVNIPEGSQFDNDRDCSEARGRCVTWAVRNFAEVLADGSKPALERAQALKFLGHFVGDMHQPLHSGYPGDRGGNLIRVKFMDTPLKLHAVWDTNVLGVAGLHFPSGAGTIADPIDETDRQSWSNFDVVGWTNEAFHFAENHAYRVKAGDKVVNGDDLKEAYQFRSLEVVKKQISRAGIRLAFLINKAVAGELEFVAP